MYLRISLQEHLYEHVYEHVYEHLHEHLQNTLYSGVALQHGAVINASAPGIMAPCQQSRKGVRKDVRKDVRQVLVKGVPNTKYKITKIPKLETLIKIQKRYTKYKYISLTYK